MFRSTRGRSVLSEHQVDNVLESVNMRETFCQAFPLHMHIWNFAFDIDVDYRESHLAVSRSSENNVVADPIILLRRGQDWLRGDQRRHRTKVTTRMQELERFNE
jgi:hypothetical protein